MELHRRGRMPSPPSQQLELRQAIQKAKGKRSHARGARRRRRGAADYLKHCVRNLREPGRLVRVVLVLLLGCAASAVFFLDVGWRATTRSRAHALGGSAADRARRRQQALARARGPPARRLGEGAAGGCEGLSLIHI